MSPMETASCADTALWVIVRKKEMFYLTMHSTHFIYSGSWRHKTPSPNKGACMSPKEGEIHAPIAVKAMQI